VAPAVSVYMSVYNGERFVGESIASVLAQTFTDFELVVVDDGSTDSTSDVIRSFKDDRIVHFSPGRMGTSAASNYALERCRADLVARLDADDLMEPNRLERQVAFLAEHPELGGAASYYWWIDEDGVVRGAEDTPLQSVGAVERQLAAGGRLGYAHSSLLLRRHAVLAVGGYDPQFDSIEDVELCLRLYQAGYLILVQPERLLRFRIHNRSVTATQNREQYFLLEAAFGNFRRRRRGLAPLPIEHYRERIETRPVSKLIAESRIASWRLRRQHLQLRLRRRPALAAATLLAAALLDPTASALKMRRALGRLAGAQA
jgi:glycosyltransferase involved in cell wall biosynthesis